MKLRKLLSLVLVAVMLIGCMTVTAFADDTSAYLDLETSDTYADSKDIDQNYTFTQDGDTSYTDVTKVKLEWTITDIAVTYASNKTWDPDTLSWKETKTVGELANKTAEFTLTNYSSKKVIGTVGFEAETALKDTLASATFDENNGATIDTVVNSDHTIDETKTANVPSNTITATLVFNKDEFADLVATTAATKYGTYTVTITEAPTIVAKCLTFTANTDNSSITPAFASGTFKYSTDGGVNWTDGVSGTEISLAKAGDTLMIKGTNCTTNATNHFVMTGSISAEGDVTSLTNELGGDVNLAEAYPNLEENSGCYQYMFSECSALTNAPALPSTVLCDNCYEGMFSGCANLTVAPTLSAKTMTYNCYANMFAGCTSLKTAPELPAKTLAENCYRSMFYDCSALMSAPELPATDLEKACYSHMFKGCTWLFETPELPATILPDGCYSSMFAESGIKSITALPEIESYGTECLSAMFNSCQNLILQEGGTMPEAGGKIFTCTTTDTDIVNSMFTSGVSPTNGTTYYYQSNNDVYRLEIVLENCEFESEYYAKIYKYMSVTKDSTISKISLIKPDGYSAPSSAVVTGGLTADKVTLSTPSASVIKFKPALKNYFYLEIGLSEINADTTIIITATETTN